MSNPMKYKKLTGIILKKQNYREADQIVTVWTAEAGKIRCLAKAVRRPLSKLAHGLIDLNLIEFEIAGSGLPVLISVKAKKQFSKIREDLKKTAIGFYASELMLKITADEHPNKTAFHIFLDFLVELERDYRADYPLLEDFSLKLLDALGFKMPQNQNPSGKRQINRFIEYILERKLKSEQFMEHVARIT